MSDHARAKLFTDPLLGILKSIFIKSELTETFEKITDDKNIFIDLSENKIYTSLNYQKPIDRLKHIQHNLNIDFGNIMDEHQEQLMSSIFLTGNEKNIGNWF
jgi:hypothetical protein